MMVNNEGDEDEEFKKGSGGKPSPEGSRLLLSNC